MTADDKEEGRLCHLLKCGKKGLICPQFGLRIQQHRGARSRPAITATAEDKSEPVNCQIVVTQRLHRTDIKRSPHVWMQVNGATDACSVINLLPSG